VTTATAATRPLDPWTALGLKMDFSRYVPRPVPPAASHHVDSERWGKVLVLKSAEVKYLRLTERDEFLYRSMDGTKTVQELVLEYYHKFESFAFDRISVLVASLRESCLLEDPPLNAFSTLRSRLVSRSAAGFVSRLARMFFDYRIEIRNLDRPVTMLYRHLFRPLFTRPAYAVYLVLAVVGTAAFAKVVSGGRFPISMLYTSQEGSVAYGALALAATTVFLILFHQGAHVFAAKSLGREVPCGGFIISYGLPFFYAETTDVWLESRRSRIMVSMAGTVSDLLLGSAGALFLFVNPDSGWSPLVFKLTAVSYAALFMDLNPLFELDGYFALSDYLEIPDLRARATEFVRKELVGKFRRRERFGPRERVFAVYGLLALAWTAVIVLAAGVFLVMQVRSAVSDIFGGESWVRLGLSVAVLVFFVIPVTVAVMALGALGVWRVVSWVRGHPAFRDARRLLRLVLGVAAVTGGAVLAIPWLVGEIVAIPAAAAPLGEVGKILPTKLFLPVWGLVYPAIVPGFLAAAAVLAVSAARVVEGSRLAKGLRLFAAFLVVDIVRSAWESYFWTGGIVGSVFGYLTAAMEMAVWVALAVWALHLLVSVGFPIMRTWRRVNVSVIALGIAGYLAYATWRLDIGTWKAARLSVGYASTALAVVCLVPSLVNYRRTLLWWGWALLLAGVAARALAGIGRLTGLDLKLLFGIDILGAGLQASLLGAVLLMFSMIVFRVILGRMAVRVHRAEREGAADLGDRARLLAALGFLVESLTENLSQAYGRTSVSALERNFNRRAERAGKPVRLEEGRLVAGELERAGILIIAEEGRWTLAGIEREASSLGGGRFFRSLMTAVYDELYWSEREPVYVHILSRFPWARQIAHLPRPQASGVDSLVEGAPLFEGLSAEERTEFASRMRPRKVAAGQTVVREGDPADAFYLVAGGTAEVYHEDAPEEALATLGRGDYFGESASEDDARRDASVRAKTDAELLEIGAADFRAFVRAHVRVAEKVAEAGEVVGMLRRMPAFREMPLAQVAMLASAMKPVRVPAGDSVVRQGEVGTALYVIASGELEVLVASGEAPPRRVAVLGPGEYFGEIALIESVPRTATVSALTDCELLALEKQDFDRRLGKSLAAIQEIGRISSRRRREIHERGTDAASRPGAEAPSRASV